MENDNIQFLVDSFIEYRKMLLPVQESLYNFSLTYNELKEDIKKLDVNLESGMQEKIEKIYEIISKQANQSSEFSNSIEKFVVISEKYNTQISNLLKVMQNIESRLTNVNNFEKQAEEQIEKLDSIIEDKKVNYNVKDLQKSLESYKVSVEKVSDFINKDIAEALSENNKKIENIKQENAEILQRLDAENSNIDKLIATYQATNELIKNSIQRNDINEEYIFEILDKWATARKIKIKK